MIELPSVTALLWNITEDPNYTRRLMRVWCYCQSLCRFRGVILFNASVMPCLFDGELYQIPPMSIRHWQVFEIKTLGLLANRGGHFITIHEDGFPIDPAMWSPEFLNYDFIGAPWKDKVVGNAGFCIASAKCMSTRARLPYYQFGAQLGWHGDEVLCRGENRVWMEKQGCTYAPWDLAARFSAETFENDKPSFGFHGRNYAPRKYAQGWAQIEAFERSKR